MEADRRGVSAGMGARMAPFPATVDPATNRTVLNQQVGAGMPGLLLPWFLPWLLSLGFSLGFSPLASPLPLRLAGCSLSLALDLALSRSHHLVIAMHFTC